MSPFKTFADSIDLKKTWLILLSFGKVSSSKFDIVLVMLDEEVPQLTARMCYQFESSLCVLI